MIIQTELYYLCQALLHLMSEPTLRLSTIDQLAKRACTLCNSALEVVSSMQVLSIKCVRSHKEDLVHAGMQIASYAKAIEYLLTCVLNAVSRVSVLAMVEGDPQLLLKWQYAVSQLEHSITKLEQHGWDRILTTEVAVLPNNAFVTGDMPKYTSMSPENMWACLTPMDKGWAELIAKLNSSGDGPVRYVCPPLLFERVNTPNYLLWACIRETYTQEHSAMRRTMLDRAIEAIIAVTAETDMSDIADNSPFPGRDKWERIEHYLPEGSCVPLIRRKTRETNHDKIADKTATANTQLLLMRLTSE